MKTREELNALREEIEALNEKLCELTDEEMEQVTGGGRGRGRKRIMMEKSCPICGYVFERTTTRAWVVCKFQCPECGISVMPRIKNINVDP